MATLGLKNSFLIGTLGGDSETRYTAGGTAVTNVSVATSDTWRDKTSREIQERAEWHRVVLFARRPRSPANTCAKAPRSYVEERIQTRKWQNKDGVDQYITKIIGNEMRMLDSAGGNREGSSSSGGGQQSAPSSSRDYAGQSRGDAPAQSQPQAPAATGQDHGFDDDLDDDIPLDKGSV